MGRDEQIEEREVLDSIFPEEITDLSETSYRIYIPLESAHHDEATAREQSMAVYRPTLILTVTYPAAYPDIAPNLSLSTPPDAPKYPHLDIQNDKIRLLSALDPTIEENLGMAMVFTLVSSLKEAAELLISERQAAAQALKDVEAAKAEEEENAKFHGTAVTRESFMEWRERFRNEMAEIEERKREEKELDDKKKRVKVEDRFTGKQLWERGLVGKIDDDLEEEHGEVDIQHQIQALKVEN